MQNILQPEHQVNSKHYRSVSIFLVISSGQQKCISSSNLAILLSNRFNQDKSKVRLDYIDIATIVKLFSECRLSVTTEASIPIRASLLAAHHSKCSFLEKTCYSAKPNRLDELTLATYLRLFFGFVGFFFVFIIFDFTTSLKLLVFALLMSINLIWCSCAVPVPSYTSFWELWFYGLANRIFWVGVFSYNLCFSNFETLRYFLFGKTTSVLSSFFSCIHWCFIDLALHTISLLVYGWVSKPQ